MSNYQFDRSRLIEELAAALDQLEARPSLMTLSRRDQAEQIQDLQSAVSLLLRASMASTMAIGECRAEVPYAPIFPVITEDQTLMWCCNHVEPHCVDA